MSGKQLAMTGAGSLVVGGVTLSGPWVLSVAIGVVLVGAVMVRVAFRRRKAVHQ
jgi:hypothetical protein